MIERVILAGGGTGGHLFPGMAVVEELRRRDPRVDVLFVGTAHGIEARVLPPLGERLELVEVTPLKGRRPMELIASVARIPGAAARAAGIVRRHRADLVIGVGGYASGPVLAAATLLGVPTALLEQNAHVGLTNRVLAPVVGRAYVSFPHTASSFSADRVRASGNPVRRAFVEAARRAVADPDGFEARARRVLVLGGSQGARAMNRVVPEALARLGGTGGAIEIVHQTGQTMREEVEARYRELGVSAQVVSFIDDMAAAYSSAAVVIARAGATTVAELCAIGRPSILVPYPHAADDHQRKNAEALARDRAALCVPEDALEPETLAFEVRRLLGDEPARRAMAERARALGKPDAAAAIVDDLCDWLGCRGARVASGTSEEPARGRDTASGGRGGAALRAFREGAPYAPRARIAAPLGRVAAPHHRRPAFVSWGD